MGPTSAKPALKLAPNGVVSPLYFDRQVVRAEDLTLDRSSHDRELARMRRLLHGWGVVAGLIPAISGTTLRVSAGYGITPSGDEVYLSEAVEIPNIVGRVWGCCGPGEPSCDMVDPQERERLAREREVEEITSWLVARPVESESDARPGVPKGCEHPANIPLPTRACDIVSIELLCDLPPDFGGGRTVCEAVMPYLCGEPMAMLPLPPNSMPEQNILILGRIVAGPETATFLPLDRRAVVPAAVLQAWLQTCVCPLVRRQPPDQPPRDGDGDQPIAPEDLGWDGFGSVLAGNGFALRRPGRSPSASGPGLATGPDFLSDPEKVRALEDAGVSGPASFLAADPDALAVALGEPVAEVVAIARELEAFRPFFNPTRL